MNILVLYATIEGQTGKIARHIKAHCEALGHTAHMRNTNDDSEAPLPEGFECVVATAPVHGGTFPLGLHHALTKHRDALMAVPGAFVSVSLAAASNNPDEVDEIAAYANRLSENTGWWPIATHHAAGALKYTQYDFFRKWMLRRIAAKEGGPTDTDTDHEFTDWPALDAFVDEFLATAPALDGKL